ncbi:hypothetical protein [Clostridium sp.]|uniref:hypothetical protein n=1 Tax=Clostridium sp. TaxID=1506 RepID=UPI00260C0C0D|nr:hypothetical protein [Clostridium sp.]
MQVLCIILGIISFGVSFFVWKKDVLSKFKIEEAALLSMTEKDKTDTSKSLASPIALLGVLFISISLNIDKWGNSFIFLLIGAIALFIYVEKRIINGINTLFKSKKKIKVNRKRK